MNHWERIETTLAGNPTDHAPVALWRHFPEEDQDPVILAQRSIEWQNKWDWDLVKFMPSGTFGIEDWGAETAYLGRVNGARHCTRPVVNKVQDWRTLEMLDTKKGVYGQQNQALSLTARELGGRVPILQTVFSPLTTARKMSGERLLADMRCAPEAVEHALHIITEVTIRFCLEALDAGADGIFFATQLATHRLVTTAEYEQFGRTYDLQVFNALKGKTRFNMLHVHGEDVMFDMMSQYPVEMMNWHDRLTTPSLKDALQRFRGMLVGGISEHGTLINASLADIEAEVRDGLSQTNARRLMIGPGCVLPVHVSDERLQTVVHAVRGPSR